MLDKNPITDIKNTRKIAGVFVNGNWIDKNKLNFMLADLAKRNIENKDKFDWKTMMSKRK